MFNHAVSRRAIRGVAFNMALAWTASCGPANFNATADPNPADVGPTHPNTLLPYVPFAGAPDYCATPELLLDELRRAVLDAGQVANARVCTASISSDSMTGPTLSLQCPLSLASEKCQEVYSARIWTERNRGSLANYKVKGFGWLQWTCVGSDSVYETVSRNMSRGTSLTLENVLAKCRPNTAPQEQR